MPVYFDYALKVSLCLAIVFLFYFLMLKRMTYYTWNRYFLLVFSLLSFIVPFVNVGLFIHSQQLESVPLVSQIPVIANKKIPMNFGDSYKAFDYWSIIFLFYVFVSFILLVRLLVQLLSIEKIRSKATLTVAEDVKIYHMPQPVIPFSFLNSIFINKNNYSLDDLKDIIDHEQVHIQQKHTYDVLISKIICILNWYNPFAWLIKNAIRENLEFIADKAVIKQGADLKNYQYLLLKVSGNIPFSITNNLKFSILKNRFSMMNKRKSGKFHLLKFALLVPLATVLLLSFRDQAGLSSGVTEGETSTGKTYVLSSLTYSIPDKKVEAVIKKELDKGFFKRGQVMNLDLDLFLREHDRLKNILEKSGYSLEKDGYKNMGKYGIIFMIDTTLGNNSFSVDVNINLAKDELSKNKEEPGKAEIKITPSGNRTQTLIEQTKPVTELPETGNPKNIGEDKVSNKENISHTFSQMK